MRRGDTYQYKRRIPLTLADLDGRGTHVRVSLKTTDLAEARAKRDVHEAADNELWASLTLGESPNGARARYQAALRRADAMGFTYRSAHEVGREPLETILRRIEAVIDERAPPAAVKAVLGAVPAPRSTVTAALEVYFDEIMRDELRGKSEDQRRRWINKRRASIATFVKLCGDKDMAEISRDDARKLHSYWMDRVAPRSGRPTHTASSGNRDMGNLRTLYGGWFDHLGMPEQKNPFDGLGFSEGRKRSRPPFPTKWIVDRVLRPGALASLNEEARAICLVLIETGARPSEICNLRPDTIDLAAAVPHIRIEPRFDPEDPREIKTESSVRAVPLVGVALAAMRRFPRGFDRYKDGELRLSATLNKHFRTNKLFPTPAHKIYSFRHSFEDRMKEGGLDEELRRGLMGHTIDRPRYGAGGSLEWRQAGLAKIALPFDKCII
ncbi:DUF6538 domain-containing protein [Antarcticirhabdus aurantiaca]|uniref:DUF6538 domain-containing protein n=1 Tax=Antarcticirhabdus aurantiaca TaxID=2606717 RepID=UPI003BB64BC2